MIFLKLFSNICFQLQFLVLINLTFSTSVFAQRSPRGRARACSLTLTVANANIQFRHNYKLMRISCVSGFTLQGKNFVDCVKGKWNAALPICAKEGCSKPDPPPNGVVLSRRFVANLYCKDRYIIAGGRVTYCNGTHWDRPLGECRETTKSVQLECDFETDDLCGWTHDENHDFDWKREMAANSFQQLRTGPQHDHTTLTANSGHYMLMESFDQRANSVARILSPVYSKNLTHSSACFKFYYFMYGATVGTLNVYVKPLSVDIDEVFRNSKYQYFTISGNQKSIWKEAMFIIEQLSEDFQIILEGLTGSNHLSDIAIDDLHLMTYSECNADYTMQATNAPEYTDFAIYDVQSCEGRCHETSSTGYGIKNVDGKFYKECDCHSECEELHTCCLNYRSVCEMGRSLSSTELVDVTTNLSTFENTATTVTTPFVTVPKTSLETPTTVLFITTSTFPKNTTTLSTTTYSIPTEATTVKEKNMKSTQTTTAQASTINFITNSETEREITKLTPITSSTSKTLEPGTSTEKTQPKIKEKIITWEIDRNLTIAETKSPVLLIFTVTFAVLVIVVVLVIISRYIEKIKKIKIRRYSSDTYSETTALTYNQRDDLILES